NVNSVTTPKLPPPPPLSAHNRSESDCLSTERNAPSAVTIRTARRLSIVNPRCREARPNPPPSVTPAIPTDGHEPPGTVTPDCARREYRSISWTPAPTVAVPA